MSGFKWLGLMSRVACLVVLAAGGSPIGAQDNPRKHDAKVLRDSLREVINQGAELFNKHGDHAGCYRLYQGALVAIKPFLPPGSQQEIDKALVEAEALPRYSDRAFSLRKTIDAVRAKAPPADAVPAPNPAPDAIRAQKMPAAPSAGEKKAEVSGATLWDRLGGEANVRKVVEEFIQAAAADPEVNLTRDGKYKLDEPTTKFLQQQLVDFISSATGGPLPYQGKNMKAAHQGMRIAASEYDAAGRHLKKALEKNGAVAADVGLVLKAIESLRPQIVEPGKKEEGPKPRVPE